MSKDHKRIGVKNVVLVHGGFVDGSGWEGVYGILKRVSPGATSQADSQVCTMRAMTWARSRYPRRLIGLTR